MDSKITLIANEKSWIEGNAIKQLKSLEELEGVIKIVGLPDLHAGKIPVGAVVETKNGIYPHIIGNDIGCGMSLFQTHIAMRQYKQDKWVKKLEKFDTSFIKIENPYEEESPIPDLGTIGGGNHFAEFQMLESIFDEGEVQKLGIGKKDILLLIHSGSRSFGQSIFSEFTGMKKWLSQENPAFSAYLKYHDLALLWAERNRRIAAEFMMQQLGFTKEIHLILDCCHNYIEKRQGSFIHRKGAVSTEQGLLVLPGSRGSLTYLIKPSQNTEVSLYSLSHGAGRKYQRSLCKGRISEKYTKEELKNTSLKSRVICKDKALYYEEAPEVYKNIEQIIECLQEYGLISVVATLKPLITYKG